MKIKLDQNAIDTIIGTNKFVYLVYTRYDLTFLSIGSLLYVTFRIIFIFENNELPAALFAIKELSAISGLLF
ncbi:hypothetical protein [Psychroserpens sp.]|uniref:hypothetical protein n=1 Tax=Psychroserpens sp. TaxID=2020870 RepID=UPI003C79043F